MINRIVIILVFAITCMEAHSEIFFVHGTNTTSKVWSKDVRNQIRNIFGYLPNTDEAELFEWSGANNTQARKSAAENLLEHIQKVRAEADSQARSVTIIGHSHGGTVALYAANKLRALLGQDIEINIVTLNTAKVSGGVQLTDNSINHFHVYCPKDKIAPYGGFSKTGILTSGGEKKAWNGAPKNGESSRSRDFESGKPGSTQRTFATAHRNIPYKDQYSFKGILPKSHIVNHRGWLPKNVQEWSPKLAEAVRSKLKTD